MYDQFVTAVYQMTGLIGLSPYQLVAIVLLVGFCSYQIYREETSE
jgi:hypothetical protein